MAPQLVDHGGPVLQHAKLVLVFWGMQWTTNVPTDADITASMNHLVAGPYLRGASQYRDIGDAQIIESKTVTDSNPPNGCNMQNVQDFIVNQVTNGSLPDFRSAGEELLYMVFLPPQCIAENAAEHNFGSFEGTTFYTAYCAVRGENNDLNNITFAASHELVEACTDATPHSGWAAGGSDEIADLCQYEPAAFSDGALAASYWSNKDNKCIVPRRLLDIRILDGGDRCESHLEYFGRATLKATIVADPPWIDLTNLPPLANPKYKWNVNHLYCNILSPLDQPTVDIQWHDTPVIQIDVAITTDSGATISGSRIFNLIDPQSAAFMHFMCRFQRRLRRFVPPWVKIQNLGPRSFTSADVQTFRSLSVELSELADKIEKLNRK